MQEIERAYFRKRIGKTLDELKKKQYEPHFLETAEEAKQLILDKIDPGETVGVGGSVTLRDGLGIVEALRKKGTDVLDHWDARGDRARFVEAKRKQRGVDVFVTSVNAMTNDGIMVSLDGGGNRVASMCCGPKRVIVVAGVNKIVDTLDAAIHRTRHLTAVVNALRINPKTPCVETGFCSDCNAAARICAALLILYKKPNDLDHFTVVLINEEMGY